MGSLLSWSGRRRKSKLGKVEHRRDEGVGWSSFFGVHCKLFGCALFKFCTGRAMLFLNIIYLLSTRYPPCVLSLRRGVTGYHLILELDRPQIVLCPSLFLPFFAAFSFHRTGRDEKILKSDLQTEK